MSKIKEGDKRMVNGNLESSSYLVWSKETPGYFVTMTFREKIPERCVEHGCWGRYLVPWQREAGLLAIIISVSPRLASMLSSFSPYPSLFLL